MSIVNNSDIDISLLNNDIFIEACKNDNIELVKKIYPLKEWIFDIEDESDMYQEENALCFCCRNGYLNAVKYICSTNTIDINSKDEEAFTLACQENNLDVAKFLYSIEPSIDIFIDFCTPFGLACRFNNLEIIKWLIEIEPSILNSYELKNYFIESCEEGSIEVAKYILSKKEDLLLKIDNCTLIRLVSQTPYLDVLKWLLKEMENSNDDIIRNTFISACVKGNINMIKYLISIYKDVEINHLDVAHNAFYEACKEGDWEIANFIIKSYSEINFLEDSECFINACYSGDIETASNLLLLNPDLSNQTNSTNIFLKICSNNKLEMAKWYFDLNKDITIYDYIIENEIDLENLEMIKWLTSIKPNLINENNIENLLSSVFRLGDIDTVEYLLDYSKDYFDLESNLYENIDFITECFSSISCDFMKWFCDKYELPKDYIDDNFDYIIEILLSSGDYEIVKILYKKYPNVYNISIKSFSIRIFKESDAIDYFEWLFQQNPNIEFEHDFKDYIENFLTGGYIRVTNWLLEKIKNYSEFRLNKKDYEYIFYNLCKLKNFDSARFLKNKFGISDDIIKSSFKDCISYSEDNLKIIKWLYSFKQDKEFYENIKMNPFSRNSGVITDFIDSELMDWLISIQFKDIEISKAYFKSDIFMSNYNLAIELIDSGKIMMNLEVYEIAMTFACTSHNFTFFQKLLKKEPALINDKIITIAIECDQFEMLKLLINKENIDQISRTKAFTKYCSRRKSNKVIDYFFSLNPKELCFHTFQYFMIVSDISFVKELYNKYSNIRNIKKNKLHIKFISEAFSKGKLEIAKWYIEIHQDINLNIESLLDCSSKNGRIESVLYLISNYNVNNLETIYMCFYNFCLLNFKDEAEKILNFKPEIKDLIDIDKIFRKSFSNNSFDTIILMIKLKPDIDVRFDDDYLFKSAVKYNKVNLAKFLTETYPSIYYILLNDNETGISDHCIFQKIYKSINNKEIDKDIENCYICGEDSNVFTFCKHFYCENCILSWLVKKKSDSTKSTCPYCRENLSSNNLFKII